MSHCTHYTQLLIKDWSFQTFFVLFLDRHHVVDISCHWLQDVLLRKVQNLFIGLIYSHRVHLNSILFNC